MPLGKHAKYLIKQVMIGKDITYIGKFNFFWCNRLETVTFEDGSQLRAHRLGCLWLQQPENNCHS